VSPNPGPETSKRNNFGTENLITVGASLRSAAITKIVYKPTYIRSLRSSQLAKHIDEHTYSLLRYFEILKPYRGLRSGIKAKQRRKIANNINNNVINIHREYGRRICISHLATHTRSHVPSNCVSIVGQNSTEQQTSCIKIASPVTTPVSDSTDTDLRNIEALTSTVSHISSKRHSNPGPNLKIVRVNIRSLRNTEHLIQVREFAKYENIDVLTISETWLNSTVTNKEINIDGYKLHRLDRLHKKGGGVCLYIRNDIKANILKDISHISDCNFHQLWLQLQYKKLKSLVVCVTYRPPDCPLTCFQSLLKPNYITALSMNKHIIILGDLNCNTLKECPENKALTDISLELNLTQIITTPTRITDRSQSLIDVILISNPDLVRDSGVINTAISDHLPVFATLKLKLPKPHPRFITVRSFKNYDRSLFTTALASNSDSLLSTFTKPDVESKLATFNSVLLPTLEAHAPVKRIKIRSRPCPYVTTEIKDLMNARDRLLRHFKTTREDNDCMAYL
jgi:exonuclease III